MSEIDPSFNWISILLMLSIAYYVLFSWISSVPRPAVEQKPKPEEQGPV